MKRIAIHSVPRSGSTWLGQIFNSNPNVKYAYQPLFSYALKGYLKEDSSKEEIAAFYQELLLTDDDFINQKEAKEKKLIPEFKKNDIITHVVYKEVRYHNIVANLLEKDKEVKVIGLVRNPLAVIASWLLAPKEFRKDLGWNESEEWQFASKKNLNKPEEFNGFEKWKEVTDLFLALEKKYPSRFKLVDYNDLLTDTATTVKEIFHFCEIPFTEETEHFMAQTKQVNNADAYSVFKTKKLDNQWEDSLDQQIVKAITTDLENTPLEKFLHL